MLLLGWLAAPVRASPAREPAIVDRLTVPRGRGVIAAQLIADVSTEEALGPIALLPDAWYGVTDRLTLGVVQSGRAATGLLGGAGPVMCPTGFGAGGLACQRILRGAGVLARGDLHRGDLAFAVDTGVVASDLTPFLVTGKLGVALRWHRGGLAIESTPAVFVALSARDRGQVDAVVVPVALTGAATAHTALVVQIGASVPLTGARDGTAVSLSVGARHALDERWALDGAFSFAAITGGENITRGDEPRVLSLGAARVF